MLLLVAARAPARASAAPSGGPSWTWTALAPAGAPSARLDPAMAYDPETGQTVLFGGRTENQFLGDTWTFDGTSWSRRTTVTSPLPMAGASIAYDQASHQVLL